MSGPVTSQVDLRFEHWQPEHFRECHKQASKAIEPFSFPYLGQIIANASDSIVLAGRKGIASIELSLQISRFFDLRIRDTGGGIDPLVEPHLFKWSLKTKVPPELLKRNLPDRNEICGGQGLTLAQCNSWARFRGGFASLKNRADVQGAEFRLFLPMISVPVGEQRVPPLYP